MATVSKLLLLLLCSYYSLIAHAEHSSYITGSVKTEAVCSEPKGMAGVITELNFHSTWFPFTCIHYIMHYLFQQIQRAPVAAR